MIFYRYGHHRVYYKKDESFFGRNVHGFKYKIG
jgi:hypothetical protein